MDPLARLADRLAIEALNADFAYHLDRGEVEPMLDLFTPDADYSNGPRHSNGIEEIAAFFRSRTAQGVRTARHMGTGLRISFESDHEASATSVWLSFAQNAAPPINYSIPFLVADFIDRYQRGQDGKWRIASRQIVPIFRDPNGVPPGGK